MVTAAGTIYPNNNPKYLTYLTQYFSFINKGPNNSVQ